MPEAMSEERLREIEARAEAASQEREWGHSRPDMLSYRSDGRQVSYVYPWGDDGDYPDDRIAVLGPTPVEDARFIAHARQDVPTLVAEVRRLQAENERLRTGADPCAMDGEALGARVEALESAVRELIDTLSTGQATWIPPRYAYLSRDERECVLAALELEATDARDE